MKKGTKLFILIGPPEAGKMVLAEALAKTYGNKIELMPRLTNKPPNMINRSAGYVRRVTPTTLKRHFQDGRLILTRENEYMSGFDRERLDRLLQKKHVVIVTDEDGVRELKSQTNDDGRPKYRIFVIRVVLRKKETDSNPPPSDLTVDMEILTGFGPDWAVHELSRHLPRLIA
ncbi:hypothetical protein HZC53_06470 [Candidatus Uhrbacteria bacterium]|nr:hypothetical protein [Candidatus Uhrbacteria bacterium]